MKSKEEILKRNVEAIAKCNVKYNVTHQGILNAMEEYAMQFKEAMADKKYTKEDIINAFNEGQALNVRGKLIQGKEWFNSLNKQD